MNLKPNHEGFFGEYGGAYVPELLLPNLEELSFSFRQIVSDAEFQREYQSLLKAFVGRPTPLHFAQKLSATLGFKVYLKREDLCHTGAHKVNNALGQVLLAKKLGKKRIIAETGAGQHGVAVATCSALLGIPCVIYMGARDRERQAPNVKRMQMLGAEVTSVISGSQVLKDATNEAIRDWISNSQETHYCIGSCVGPHPFPEMVAAFQSVISRELLVQVPVETGKENPDLVIACIGGGSNSIGAFYHFIERSAVELIGVEAGGKGATTDETAATMALGRCGVFHGSKTLVLQNSDGQIKETHSISAGLDYPGVGPQHAHLKTIGRVKYVNATDEEALKAAHKLSRLEGIIPALESAHALAYLERLEIAPGSCVILCLSGRGDKDMRNYERFMATGTADFQSANESNATAMRTGSPRSQ